jgi:dephospho-CoA kinase
MPLALDAVNTSPTPWVLTGAIGSGKSTVGSLLAARGARVIDADRIGHAVIDPSGSAFDAVAYRWPDVVVAGRVDRKALGSIVFADPGELAALEAITHPRIVERLTEFVRETDAPAVVVEISVPHLEVDETWGRIVVVASEGVRRRRLASRGLEPQEIDQRIAAQPAAAEWIRPGDVVISNEGTPGELEAQVDALWLRLSQPA